MDTSPASPAPTHERSPDRLWMAQPIMAGVLAGLVGYASTFALVLAGLAAAGATPAQAGSGLFAICLAQAVLNILFAWRMRMPISFAWSTPGAAFLIATGPVEGEFPVVVGAFIVAAGLIVIAGVWKPFARAVAAIPAAIASAMLAGVLLSLCLAPIKAIEVLPWQALTIIAVWALGLKFLRRYAVPLAVGTAFVILLLTTSLPEGALDNTWPSLHFVAPAFSLDAVIRLAIPLFVITMASQNLPGLAVLRANGFQPAPGPLFVSTGIASAVVALFGAITVNLAAITAAICAGPEAHPDPARRWIAPIALGVAYVALGLLAGLAAAFIHAVPPILIQAVAGLALFTSLAGALAGALQSENDRLPAIVTFITTASGITLFGIGGAFWGLVGGIALSLLLRTPPRPA